MKQTIIAILLSLAAGQSQADGFRPWDNRVIVRADEQVQQAPAQTDHRPWYFTAQRQAEPSRPDSVQLEVANLGPYYVSGQI